MKRFMKVFLSACVSCVAVCCLIITIIGVGNKVANVQSIERSIVSETGDYASDETNHYVFSSVAEYVSHVTEPSSNETNHVGNTSGYYLITGLPEDAVLSSIEMFDDDCVFTYSLVREPNISIEPDEEQLMGMFTQYRFKVFRGRTDTNPAAFAQSLATAIGATSYDQSTGLYRGNVYANIKDSNGNTNRVFVGTQTIFINAENKVEYSYIPASVLPAEASIISSQYITISSDISE